MSSTAVGIALMLVSTTLHNMGGIFQKQGLAKLPPLKSLGLRRSVIAVVKSGRWLLGYLSVQISLALNFAALSFADVSVVQSVHGFGMVVLALAAWLMLGEHLTRRTILGMFLITAGVLVMGLMAGEGRTFTSLEALDEAFWTAPSLILCTCLGVIAAVSWLLGPCFKGMPLAIGAASASVLGITLVKFLTTRLSILGWSDLLSSASSWGFIAAATVAMSLTLVLQQTAYQAGRAVVVVTAFNATTILLPLAVGQWVYGEDIGSHLLVPVFVIILGVGILGTRKDEDEMRS